MDSDPFGGRCIADTSRIVRNKEDPTRFDVAIIGLGYVGLPLVAESGRVGLKVLGYDTDQERVEMLNEQRSHVEDVGDDEIAVATAAGFQATTDPTNLAEAEVVVICVPTPFHDHQPDLSAVRAAATDVGRNLRPGQLIVLESTTYPGTTEEIVRPILEEESGLRCCVDFDLAYSPERIDPGNTEYGLRNTPKVVGGVSHDAAKRTQQFYEQVCDEVVVLSGTREAEMAKLLENTYRHVNIALVNEMAIFCRDLGVDIWESIRGASTKPFGFEAFTPGPGVGGHCIPIDPNYLSYRVRQLGYQFRLVEVAEEVNSRMPAYVVGRIGRILNDDQLPVSGSKILLLGVAYKPNVGDMRETPARNIAARLVSSGADVRFWDPHVSEFVVSGVSLERVEDPIAGAEAVDLAVVVTPHDELDLVALTTSAAKIYDTRGVAGVGFERSL